MSERKPSYYSVIPASVRYDNKLSASEKVLYSEISALVNMQGHCFASNGYFADLYGVSKVTVSRWIASLSERGHIACENIMDGKKIEKRQLFLVNDPINKNDKGGINENVKGGINKNVKGNTIVKNNTTRGSNKNVSTKGDSMSDMLSSDFSSKSLSRVKGIKVSLAQFEAHRSEIRKPMTNQARKLMLGKLSKYHEQGYDVVEMLETAVERGWLSVYTPKNKKGHSDAQSATIIRGNLI